MKFRLIDKKTGEDITDVVNPLMCHSGEIVVLSSTGAIYTCKDMDRFEVKLVKPCTECGKKGAKCKLKKN